MKILIIDEEFPYPLNTGKRIRTYNLTRELSKYNEIHYLAYGIEDSQEYKHFREVGFNPEAVMPPDRKQSGIRFYLKLLANLFSQYPYIVTSHYSSAFQRRLRQLSAQYEFDVIICEWTPYALFLKEVNSARSIIVAHNIESSIWRRYEENERNPLKRFYIAIQRRKVERFEQNCFGWVSGATAVSRPEANSIASLGVGYPVAVIDNGVDVEYFSPQPAEPVANRLVFTGSMDWRPNQDACLYFVHEIFPLIKREKPDISAVFVGRKPPKQIQDLQKIDGVTITGSVDDVRPFIAESAIYIVPLRIGGGSRLKILEAMAMKKAVVSTSVGAEGLEVADGDNIIVADGATRFAEEVIRCLDDTTLRNRVALSGYQLVHGRYRWSDIGARYNEYLMSVAGSK